MLFPIKIVELELSQPLPHFKDLFEDLSPESEQYGKKYGQLQALVRLYRKPLGYLTLPIINGQCAPETIALALEEQLKPQISQQLWQNGLLHGLPPSLMSLAELRGLQPPESAFKTPLVTVAICTRDRPQSLARCLDSLLDLDYPQLDLLVVDNAPSNAQTAELVASYANIRYVKEPRPGLSWARNCAIREARGEIIAYTDDDVQVDRTWIKAIAQTFHDNPKAMAVTGLVAPAELETPAQINYEISGGLGKGFDWKRWQFPQGNPSHWRQACTSEIGTGANMAFRRACFRQRGEFDPSLGAGTPAQGGEDLELFFRILKGGFEIIYQPDAIVFHYHHRDDQALTHQLFHQGSVYGGMQACVENSPENRGALAISGLMDLLQNAVIPVLQSSFSPQQFPRALRWAKLRGALQGQSNYRKAKAQTAAVLAQYGPQAPFDSRGDSTASSPQAIQLETNLAEVNLADPAAIAVRTVELSCARTKQGLPLAAIADVVGFHQTRLLIQQGNHLWGFVNLKNQGKAISAHCLAQAIAQQLGPQHLPTDWGNWCVDPVTHAFTSNNSPTAQTAKVHSPRATTFPSLPHEVMVSIVIPTCNRPDRLRNCLQGIIQQDSTRQLEIIVVDNSPGSGLTPPILEEFPQVTLIEEPRAGVSYARNAGILASQGEIIVTLDDDITPPTHWLEQLVAPFMRADIMCVAGNVIAIELETHSQRLFENYANGGLSRGFENFEVDNRWLERSWRYAPQVWELGCTANSAFRASLFRDPAVGLMDETLGPGMPARAGEDIYFFYKLLKAGHTLFYQADAYAWHCHRRTMEALGKQLYGYGCGFVAYHLMTLIEDGDWRAVEMLLVFAPKYNFQRIWNWIWGDRDYPLSLILKEICGQLEGPWALWRSRRCVTPTEVPWAQQPPTH